MLFNQAYGRLDRALLVGADRESQVARFYPLLVLCNGDSGAGGWNSLNTYKYIHNRYLSQEMKREGNADFVPPEPAFTLHSSHYPA